MALYHGQIQNNSPLNRLPHEILFEIYRYVLPATPILAKITEISAKVFRAQSTALKSFDTSIYAKQLNEALKTALSAKKFTENAAKNKTMINDFLQQELGMIETKKYIKSPVVALLCKYHLLAKGHVYQSPNQPDHFQLKEPLLKRPTP